MPESAGDVFMTTSLLPSIKKNYPDKDLYFATKKEYLSILDGNKYIYKTLEYSSHRQESSAQWQFLILAP